MRIKLLTVGRLKEAFFRDALAEYKKRLSRYAQVEVIEVADQPAPEKLTPAQKEQVLRQEGERLLSHIQEQDTVIALCIEGRQMSSEALAATIDTYMNTGKSSLCFIIGGSLGLSPEVVKKASLKLSFSPMTFSHQIFRVMLLEQVYRAFKIIRGEPYHK